MTVFNTMCVPSGKNMGFNTLEVAYGFCIKGKHYSFSGFYIMFRSRSKGSREIRTFRLFTFF